MGAGGHGSCLSIWPHPVTTARGGDKGQILTVRLRRISLRHRDQTRRTFVLFLGPKELVGAVTASLNTTPFRSILTSHRGLRIKDASDLHDGTVGTFMPSMAVRELNCLSGCLSDCDVTLFQSMPACSAANHTCPGREVAGSLRAEAKGVVG